MHVQPVRKGNFEFAFMFVFFEMLPSTVKPADSLHIDAAFNHLAEDVNTI